jgi:hypothetical protein
MASSRQFSAQKVPTPRCRVHSLLAICLAVVIQFTCGVSPGYCQDKITFKLQPLDKNASDLKVRGRTNFNTAAGSQNVFVLASADFEPVGDLQIVQSPAIQLNGGLTSVQFDFGFLDKPSDPTFATIKLVPSTATAPVTPPPFNPDDLKTSSTLKIHFDKVADPTQVYSLADNIQTLLTQKLRFEDRNRDLGVKVTLGFGQNATDKTKPDTTYVTTNSFILDFVTWKDIKSTAVAFPPTPPTVAAVDCGPLLVIPRGAEFLVDTTPNEPSDAPNGPPRSARLQEGMTLGWMTDKTTGRSNPCLKYDMYVDQTDGVQVNWKLRIVDRQSGSTAAYVRVFPRTLTQGTRAVCERDVAIIPVNPSVDATAFFASLQTDKTAYFLDRQGSEVRPLDPESFSSVVVTGNLMKGYATRVDPRIDARFPTPCDAQ